MCVCVCVTTTIECNVQCVWTVLRLLHAMAVIQVRDEGLVRVADIHVRVGGVA